ncbi:MAG TPA: cupin domain-containing protein [Polyangia bacterium]|nr:cupin domain-containing protein [Polyangia bacterium]
MSHVDDLLPEHVLRTLGASERARVAAHVDACGHCAGEHAAARAALDAIAAALPAVTPAPAVRARLLERVRGRSRFAPFCERVAALFDLAVAEAEALLETLDEPAGWVRGPDGTSELSRVLGGPRLAQAEAGFVRLDPGARFPHHLHRGQEVALLLQGQLSDADTGEIFGAGDWVLRPAGSAHSVVALSGGCLFAVVAWGGVDFGEPGWGA